MEILVVRQSTRNRDPHVVGTNQFRGASPTRRRVWVEAKEFELAFGLAVFLDRVRCLGDYMSLNILENRFGNSEESFERNT